MAGSLIEAAEQLRRAAPPPPPPPLPPLRDELSIEPGPILRGGAPSWTLYDPATHRYYRLGWQEFEILARWHLRRPADIVARVNAETTLDITVETVDQVLKFLTGAELLRGAAPDATQRMLERRASRRHGLFKTLLHNYLFIRIPLIRPDAALGAMVPLLSFVYTRTFFIVTVLAGLLGLYLVLRQWDVFAASLPWFFSFEGVALASLGLLLSKMLHELGHGLTAKRFGCNVPSMGVALLVMFPVLYTDTSGAWGLTDRRKRLAIGVAGMAAECCLAAYALLIWNFLPDGPLRSVVFIWATTTWILTLLVNLSPFMRFDGYYLLADFLDVPNMQERAFALTRHKLREILFDLGEPPPETWSKHMRRILIAYAVGTWIYRFILFLGIALLVYYMFFKLLGILLFVVEIWWFILNPIMREIGVWLKQRRGRKMNARTLLTLTFAVVVLALFFVPWRTSIHAPAVLAAQSHVRLYTEVPGRVARVLAAVGDEVLAGQPLVQLDSPDVAYRLEKAERAVASLGLQWQVAAQKATDGDSAFSSKAQLLIGDLQKARAELTAAQTDAERLLIRSSISGRVMEMADPLGIGEWVKVNDPIALVADTGDAAVEAYIYEADLDRVLPDAEAFFIAGNPAASRMPASIVAIDDTATRALMEPELASVYGGPIAIRADQGQEQTETLVPELPVYRVLLKLSIPVIPERTQAGTAIIEGRPASVAAQVWRRVLSVLIRESGF
ncbi:HlyD family efflux transporter periplasmic adaptor subunit [Pseudochelatococcus contaminans]|uniref:Putative peptide zinc metalloprotease protein n=1 Tax=Pseudochelatococcus contaminans TaxID=1538103 RepID=A0A7W5Z3E4_9HYPH|nr:HlyD family efflux transporter periplasmic adaptor subunit [Pseudochelatococcus contaminans]MBB3809264.1 putative peptide zinc metalloprotease protein [Pseudochelatococcus contaminans]